MAWGKEVIGDPLNTEGEMVKGAVIGDEPATGALGQGIGNELVRRTSNMGWTVLTGEFSGQSTTVRDCSTAWGTCTSQFDTEAEIKRIVEWLTMLKKSGCKGVVLGLSGGKDSTVVAMLAVKAWKSLGRFLNQLP